ncbi:hypothetical protein [Streptomyces sp. NPDC048277]|uniref:hypothetical protein n=1 Tax=Streptomyces sp. NPDC048277 TaxID=3155027 RepID=UPI0033EA752B
MTGIQYFWRHPLAEQMREEGRDEAYRQAWEEGWKEGWQQGRIEARAEMVLKVLEWRGISVGAGVCARVADCGELDLLQVWLRRALHVEDAAEIFLDV